MRLFSRPKPPASPSEFWNWIQSAQGRQALADLTSPADGASQRAVAALNVEIRKVNPDLLWGYHATTPGCLEISAGGIESLIPAVEELVAAAPDMADLNVVAFRQPSLDGDFSLQVGEGVVKLDETLAVTAPKRPDGRYNIAVFLPLPSTTPQPTLLKVGFILLDHGFGEHFVMTRLGAVECRTIEDSVPEAVPIPELARALTNP